MTASLWLHRRRRRGYSGLTDQSVLRHQSVSGRVPGARHPDRPARRAARRARTLPGRWYADPDHHERELAAVFRAGWVGVGCADDVAAPGSYLATTVGGLPGARRPRRRRHAAGVPQRLPPPRLAARRRVRSRPRPVVPVPRLGVPPRRLAGPRRWRRASRSGSTRPTSRCARSSVTTFARSILVNVEPDGRAVRSRPAGRRPRAVRASTSSSSASAPATSGTSTGRCCSRTTARTTTRRSSTRSCRRPATSTRSSAPGRP